MAVLIYRGFEGSKIFGWCRKDPDHRATVLFPAEPFFDRCIERVLKWHLMGKTVLAWGNREGLDRLKAVLKERQISCVPFSESPSRQPQKKVASERIL